MCSLIAVSFVRQVRTDMTDNLFTSTCISKQTSNRTYAITFVISVIDTVKCSALPEKKTQRKHHCEVSTSKKIQATHYKAYT